MNLDELSKEISYVLRHAPWEYELEIDDEGWCKIDLLLDSLRNNKKFKNIGKHDLEIMIQNSEKKRHEINEGRIRALYGHSIKNKIIKEKKEPPEFLYHGTAKRFIENIKKEGLKPKERQYVHLSIDKETAQIVGKRRDDKPAILTIRAKEAWKDGHNFYGGNDKVWLADFVNSNYIIFNNPI